MFTTLALRNAPISRPWRICANLATSFVKIPMVAIGPSHPMQLSPRPLVFTGAIVALEVLVAVLQAYVFAVLTSLYLHDALHPGH